MKPNCHIPRNKVQTDAYGHVNDKALMTQFNKITITRLRNMLKCL